MAHGPVYKVPLRRRREGKTNFYKRREMLKSGSLRVVIRRSSKNLIVQFVEAKPDGDVTLVSASSAQLSNFKWQLSGGNIPAAYLTGLLAGKRAVKSGIEGAILDLGLQRNSKGGRIYAALKGITEAGINVPLNEKIFPPNDVLEGSHISKIAEYVKKEDAKAYKSRFAKYNKAKIVPSDIVKHIKGAKAAIEEGA